MISLWFSEWAFFQSLHKTSGTRELLAFSCYWRWLLLLKKRGISFEIDKWYECNKWSMYFTSIWNAMFCCKNGLELSYSSGIEDYKCGF